MPTSKLEKLKEFRVITASGIVIIKGDAVKIGNFAVHKGIGLEDGRYIANGGGYAITHLPSGYDLTKNHFSKRRTAIKFMRKYHEALSDTNIVGLRQLDPIQQKLLAIYHESIDAWFKERK